MLFAIVSVLVAGLSAGAVYGTYHVVSNRAASSIGQESARLLEEIQEKESRAQELLRYKDGYCSQAQYESIHGQIPQLEEDLAKEKESLVSLEGNLDSSQQQVEEKEAHQQELKSSKEEDEIKLEELLTSYQDNSSESIALEQKLAQSMKNLESIMSDLTLTDDQRSQLDALNEALSAAGENLRTLITEYESVNERLKMLREQHDDLEEEYTKLVEQQLGE
ncbi:hypothetical protein MRY87_13420 [bacterium]|nr:hypothetical protein [bacterium]